MFYHLIFLLILIFAFDIVKSYWYQVAAVNTIKLALLVDDISNYKMAKSKNFTIHLIINNTNSKCILLLYDPKTTIDNMYPLIKFLFNYASVCVIEYCTRHTNTIISRIKWAWDYVTKFWGFNPNNISIYGHSGGCHIAIKLLSHLSSTMDMANYPDVVVINCASSCPPISYINHITKIIITHDDTNYYCCGRRIYNKFLQLRGCDGVKLFELASLENVMLINDEYIYVLAEIFN